MGEGLETDKAESALHNALSPRAVFSVNSHSCHLGVTQNPEIAFGLIKLSSAGLVGRCVDSDAPPAIPLPFEFFLGVAFV
jgi:hypothetical protein